MDFMLNSAEHEHFYNLMACLLKKTFQSYINLKWHIQSCYFLYF